MINMSDSAHAQILFNQSVSCITQRCANLVIETLQQVSTCQMISLLHEATSLQHS